MAVGAKRSGAVSLRCPLGCGALRGDATVLRDNRFALPHTIRIGWCDECGLGVTLDPPRPEELSALYETEYAGMQPPLPRTGRLARAWHALNGSLALTDAVRAGPVLDVGCHTGEALVALRSRGLEVVGLEPNTKAAAVARARGLEVIEEPIEQAELPRSHFASILLSQVLEHVAEPHVVLRKAREALRPDGVAYIVVPNAASAWRSVFGPHWLHWHVPFHLLHHSERSLAKLCWQCGLSLRRTKNLTPGEWILLSLAAWRNARRGRFSLEPMTGRFGRRLLVAPLGRTLDALHRGDAIYAEAVPAGA